MWSVDVCFSGIGGRTVSNLCSFDLGRVRAFQPRVIILETFMFFVRPGNTQKLSAQTSRTLSAFYTGSLLWILWWFAKFLIERQPICNIPTTIWVFRSWTTTLKLSWSLCLKPSFGTTSNYAIMPHIVVKEGQFCLH